MERRSTADSFVHFSGDVVSNVESSHGVHLRGGSTGGIIEPIGDDTNVSLTVRAKNTGILTLGNSSNVTDLVGSSLSLTSTFLNLNSSDVVVGNASTTPMSGIQRYVVQFTAPTMSSGIDGGSTVSTVTVTGLTTGTVLMFTPTNPINALYNVRAGCSTAAEAKLYFSHNGISTLGSGESTNRGVLLEFRF